MDAKNSLDLESVKDELRPNLTNFIPKLSLLFCLKQSVLQHYKIGQKCFCNPTISKLKTIAN